MAMRPYILSLLLLTLLTACAADPAASLPPAAPGAPTFAPAETPAPATLAPTEAPQPAATPTPRPQPRLILPADDAITTAEQATLQAQIDAPPAEWGLDPETMDVQAALGEDGKLYLTLLYKPATDTADPQPVGRIIVLESLTGPAVAFADLAGARAAAEANGQPPVSYIWVDYEGQVVGADENGQAVVIFDIAANAWRPVTPIAPEPTATPESRIKEENGVYTVMTEKGEVVTAPAVPGTKQAVEVINRIDRVVYRAEAGNPYGLEAGAIAGYFYPDTYNVTEKVEDAQVKGGLVLHAKLIDYMYKQIDSPQKKAIFALPFDPTRANKSDDPMIFVQETTNTAANMQSLFFSVPRGTWIVNNLPPLNPTDANARTTAQRWGTSINLAYPQAVKGLYFLNMSYDGTQKSLEKAAAGIGYELVVIGSDEFTEPSVVILRQTARSILPASGVNLEMYANSLWPEGRDKPLNLTQASILQVDGAMTMVMSEKFSQK